MNSVRANRPPVSSGTAFTVTRLPKNQCASPAPASRAYGLASTFIVFNFLSGILGCYLIELEYSEVSEEVKVRPYNSALRSEQATATRGRIAQAAAQLFADHGYSHTSIEQIAQQAGVGRAPV